MERIMFVYVLTRGDEEYGNCNTVGVFKTKKDAITAAISQKIEYWDHIERRYKQRVGDWEEVDFNSYTNKEFMQTEFLFKIKGGNPYVRVEKIRLIGHN
jgi:hypothetical protein